MFAQISIIYAALVVSTASGQGKYPCHANRELMGADSCSGIKLPPNLCSSCPLKPVAGNGDFVNCAQIYDIDAPSCKAVLQEYVSLNACDDKRRDQVEGWSSWDKTSLDYFVYSVCEQCCDCIPKGTQLSDFSWMSNSHTDETPLLYKPERGNCPAHAFYDVCKIYPSIKFMKLPWGDDHWDWPEACPLLRSWFYSGASNNWANNEDTSMSEDIKRFLNNVNVANQCKQASVWTKCRNMEAAQGRVR